MDVERAFKVVGACGRYQSLLFFAVASSSIILAWQMVMMVFVGHDSPLKKDKDGKKAPDGMYTIVDEWDLRGDREYIASTIQAIFMLGVLIGNISIGQLSDKYGRKPIYFRVLALLIIVSFLSTFANDWRAFCAIRFFCGLFQGGVVLVGFVLAQELVGSSVWPITGSILPALFALGIMMLSWLASIFTYWRHLCLVISIPAIIFLFTYWMVPESPRWLYSQGRVAEAEQVMHYLAKKNGRSSSEVASIVLEGKKGEKKSNKNGYSLLDLFSSRNLAKRTLIMAYTWFVCSFTYYGLTFAAQDLAESIYVSLALSGLVEIPATFICAALLNRPWAGRRRTLIVFLSSAGAFCFSIMLLSDASGKSTARTVMALGGKFGITAAFCIIYIYASELFPTVVRNVGMGSSSMSARLGGMLSPYIHLVMIFGPPTPYLLYGFLSVVAAGFISFLPETLNQPVPDTLDDVGDEPKRTKVKSRKGFGDKEMLINDDDSDYVQA